MSGHFGTKRNEEQILVEIKKMDDIIAQCKDAQDDNSKFQLRAARALKFSLECMLNPPPKPEPAPAPKGPNILSLCEYRIQRTNK